MKTNIEKDVGKLSISLGWFPGESWAIGFNIVFDLNSVVSFDIHILKFVAGIYYFAKG